MRRVIGFLGSLGVGVMLTAAGLVFDARLLFYAGIIMFAVMAALSLWAWARPVYVPAAPLLQEPQPVPTTPEEEALVALKKARDNAAVARKLSGQDGARRAYHELQAALLTTKQHFGIGPLEISGEGTFKQALAAYVAYVDEVLPLLRQGHIEEARRRAAAFTWGS